MPCHAVVLIQACRVPALCEQTRDPARWKEEWAWWSLPHRQYLLFLALLLTPANRAAVAQWTAAETTAVDEEMDWLGVEMDGAYVEVEWMGVEMDAAQ